MSKTRKTYQIRIEGGAPFAVQIKANPTLVHDGTLTLWSGHLEERVYQQLVASIKEAGEGASFWCVAVAETPQQKQIREERKAQEGLPFFQTEECPLCFFYDLHTESRCGIDDWDQATLDSAMEMEAAVKSRKKCSLSK